MRPHHPSTRVAALALAAMLAAAGPVHALEVWSGRTLAFAKADGADWTLAANQDRITPLVWLTRKSNRGLFNIAAETGYAAASPTGTEWATGDAANHASLTFQPWVEWAQHNPPGTVGVNACVHLISEDIYLDIRIDSWTSSNSGGGFSYTRAVRPTSGVPPVAARFALRGFASNPARAGAALEFTLPDAAPARLEVLDVAGRRVAHREVGALGAGTHRVTLEELRGVPPGLLFVRLTREGRTLLARATFLR